MNNVDLGDTEKAGKESLLSRLPALLAALSGGGGERALVLRVLVDELRCSTASASREVLKVLRANKIDTVLQSWLPDEAEVWLQHDASVPNLLYMLTRL